MSNASSSAGATVCTWQYTADTDTPTHRHWMFCPLRNTGEDTGIHQLAGSSPRPTSPLSGDVYDLTGRRVLSGAASGRALQQLPHGIYIINGKKFQR